jgi:hypothetical protein
MVNKFARGDSKRTLVTATFTGGGAYNPAAANTRTITFPCKSIRSINDVQLTAAVGYYAVPVAVALNTVAFRMYKLSILYVAAAGGGSAVTITAAGVRMERAAGAANDAGASTLPVEVPVGAGIVATVTGIAMGDV